MYKLAIIFAGDEFHNTIHLSEEGMVSTDTNTNTCMEFSTTLTNDDIAWDDNFATKLLDAETLAMRFATVFGTTYTFFMCHDLYAPVSVIDGFNLNFGKLLAMTVFLLIALAALFLENDDFVALQVREHFEAH
jgi:hypothetical protein